MVSLYWNDSQVYTHVWYIYIKLKWLKLEQLERLRSEDIPTASWLPIPLSHIGSQVKRRQSQSYKFKEFAKISNFWILKQTLQTKRLLKLLDKMCKYEMDPMSIVEDTERAQFCPQMDRRTDGQGETSIPPFQLRWSGGYQKSNSFKCVREYWTQLATLSSTGLKSMLQQSWQIW